MNFLSSYKLCLKYALNYRIKTEMVIFKAKFNLCNT